MLVDHMSSLWTILYRHLMKFDYPLIGVFGSPAIEDDVELLSLVFFSYFVIDIIYPFSYI